MLSSKIFENNNEQQLRATSKQQKTQTTTQGQGNQSRGCKSVDSVDPIQHLQANNLPPIERSYSQRTNAIGRSEIQRVEI